MKKLIKFIKENYMLLGIVVLAIFLRTWQVVDVPPSLNWDEVSHGYNAYSILKTGKDEWGETLPSIFRAYGDYKLPVYIYLTSLSVWLFGLSAFAVRFMSVVAGVGSVVFTYFLAREIFVEKKYRSLALIASFLVAVEPWSLFLSRGGFEANLALFFIIAGVYLFLRGIRTSKGLGWSIILFGLSVWTYNSARVFVPLMILSLVLVYWKDLIKLRKKNSRKMFAPIIAGAILFLPMFWQLVNPVGQARYGWVSIIDEGAVASINEARRVSELSPKLNLLVNNKATYFAKEFSKNYISHFSYGFLFKDGGSHFQFNVPGSGLIYRINLLFGLFGIIYLLKKKGKGLFVILSWFLLSPVASSMTREAPHVLRSIVMLPIPMILSSLGVYWVAEKIRVEKGKLAMLVVYGVVIGICTFNYFNNYINLYAKEYSWAWQYGYEQVYDYVDSVENDYEKIIISKKYGEPHEFLLFYQEIDPEVYQNNENLIRFFQSDWYWVDRFDKYYFVNDWEIPNRFSDDFVLESGGRVSCGVTPCLFVTSPGNAPEGWEMLETIKFLDDKPAFEIYNNR